MEILTTGRWAILSAISLLLLAGCATTAPSGVANEPARAADDHLIMADLAARRGEHAVAAGEYVEAAEGSTDRQLSERATAYAFDLGFDAYALRAARRWSGLDPASPAANLYLSRLLLRRHDLDGAVAAARAALQASHAEAPEDFLLLAGELGKEDDAEAVTRVLVRLTAPAPESGALHLAVARAALRSGDLDLALDAGRAAQADQAAPAVAGEAAVLVAQVLRARGEDEAAIGHLARLVETDSSAELDMEYARLLANAGRPADALQVLDDLERREGTNPDLRRLRALIRFDAGDRTAAWEEFAALLKEGEFVDELLYYLAEASLQQGRVEQAMGFFARVPEGPYLVAAQAALVRIVELREGADKALEQLQEAAGRHPQYGFELRRFGVTVLERAGRTREAIGQLDEAITYRPFDTELLLARATLQEQAGEIEAALSDMADAVAIDPDDAVALNALGYTLANRTGRLDEASRLIRRALEREPRSAAILDSYGWVLYRRGLLAEARSYLQRAYGQLPDPEVAAHLGEVMWQQGEREAARRLWQQAHEQSPDSAPLRDTMHRFGLLPAG